MAGHIVDKVDISAVLRGMGVKTVETINPLELDKATEAVRRAAQEKGVKAIIFRSPCVALSKPTGKHAVDAKKCIGCRKCIREIGCPALLYEQGKARIDRNLCAGCGLCAQICPAGAIGGEKSE